jgi:hypothetical protein
LCEIIYLRDRPFNWKGGLWFFVSFRIFFPDNTRVRIFIFFCSAKREIFFQNSTLGYMTKTLNQIIFVFLHQNQNIFFSNIGNQNIFLEQNHTPTLQVKWSSPYYVQHIIISSNLLYPHLLLIYTCCSHILCFALSRPICFRHLLYKCMLKLLGSRILLILCVFLNV